MGIVEMTIHDKEQKRKEKILRKVKITDGWFQRFNERQPQLSVHKGDSTAFAQMDTMKKEEELDSYFITLKCILVEHD